MASEPGPASSKASKSHRTLACLPCRTKKLKCDHGSPCTNCVKAGVQCAPGSMAQRPRTRRFPERALLERIRKYEDLLHENNIPFEPLHSGKGHGDARRLDLPEKGTEYRDGSTPSSAQFESKNAWHTMSYGFRETENDSDSSQDDVREGTIKNEWHKFVEDSDHLLFSLPRGTIDLTTIHPSPAHIFRLWQVYLDNVNPLLKVTHVPTLQGRMVEAASSIADIEPTLEALMLVWVLAGKGFLQDFSWGVNKLYGIISVRPSTAPQSLSSMLGVAIRNARRMGIHNEAMLGKMSPFEAEVSRRLWWALALFDDRIGQIAGSKSGTLDPTWDCKTPLNVNDSELWPQMKEPPTVDQGKDKSSEAIFATVRSELGDFIRHSALHLDFTQPVFKPLVRADVGGFVQLKGSIEEIYLGHCNMENPLHAMTVWTARVQLCKSLLLESQSKHSMKESYTDADRDTETLYAIQALEQDTLIMASPLTRGFTWFNHAYFPFPAYMQISQDLRRRPRQKQRDQAWKAMNDNFEVWSTQFSSGGPFFRIFSDLILEAWQAGKVTDSGTRGDVPGIAQAIQRIQTNAGLVTVNEDAKQYPKQSTDAPDAMLLQHSRGEDHLAMPLDAYTTHQQALVQPLMYPDPFEQNFYMDWTGLGGWPGWSGR